MSKVFCGDCEYCKTGNPGNTSAKCQHPNNMVDENWYSVGAKYTCAYLNENNDCTWFSDKKLSDSNSIEDDEYDVDDDGYYVDVDDVDDVDDDLFDIE